MKAQHTPGPWTAHETKSAGFSIRSTMASGRAVVARAHGSQYHAESEAAANSALIAAAPELMAALELLLSVDDDLEYPVAIEKARAAISKAKGE